MPFDENGIWRDSSGRDLVSKIAYLERVSRPIGTERGDSYLDNVRQQASGQNISLGESIRRELGPAPPPSFQLPPYNCGGA